ncbi:MAG TPA: hypothetical protein VFA43_26605 [Gemmatimonadaceae bacterium]|nr:hypothetical protein [Gemmatimonadaceae bacterium]
MALIEARSYRRPEPDHPRAAFLIHEGRRWAQRHDLHLPDDLALEVGYTLLFQPPVNLVQVYDALGVNYVLAEGTKGQMHPVRVEETAETTETATTGDAATPAKSAKIAVRMTEEERVQLERAAKVRGVPVSSLLRELTFRALAGEEALSASKKWGGIGTLPNVLRRTAHSGATQP